MTLDLDYGYRRDPEVARAELAQTIGGCAREPMLSGIAPVLARTLLEVCDRRVVVFARLGASPRAGAARAVRP